MIKKEFAGIILMICLLCVFINSSFAAKNKVTIQININGGKLSAERDLSYTLDGSGYILKNGSRSIHTFYYGEKTGSSGLANLNNKDAINVEREGNWSIDYSKAYNTKPDGSGKSYSQKDIYNTSAFADVSKGDKIVTLYVNWVNNGYDVDWTLDKSLKLEKFSVSESSNYTKTSGTFSYRNKQIPNGALQGMTVSDKYLVFAVITDNTDNTNIVIVDKKTFNILNIDSRYCFAHANGLTYDKNSDTYYSTCYNHNGNNYIVSFKIGSNYLLNNVQYNKAKRGYTGLAFDYDNNVLYGLSGNYIYTINNNYEETGRVSIRSTNLIRQDISYYNG